MRAHLLSLAPIVLALAACGSSEDREGGVSEAAGDIVADSPELAPRSDADVAGAPDAEGMRWVYKPATQTALWGPANGEGLISLSCNESMTGDTVLDFQWIAEATADASRTITVRSGDASGAIAVTGVPSVLGPSAIWQGGIERSDPVARMLESARSPITFTLGEETVTTQPGDALRRAIAACA